MLYSSYADKDCIFIIIFFPLLQWLRLLLASKSKFKAGDERQAYAVERPEPLLHFALSSGSHSDPAVISGILSFLLFIP